MSFDFACFRYKKPMAASSMEHSVSLRSLVEFDWTAEWNGGTQTGSVTLQAYKVLDTNRSLPMPSGWKVALRALCLHHSARDVCDKERPLDVSKVDCRLLGQPKRVPALTDETSLAPGACVALVKDGRRVNYVLVAHIYSDCWLCSPGGKFHDEGAMGTLPWRSEDCVEKDVVREAWSSEMDSKRRQSIHLMGDNLRRRMQEHSSAFDALVADQTWKAEERRSELHNRAFDPEAAKANFESNPFLWHNDRGRDSQVKVEFVWFLEKR